MQPTSIDHLPANNQSLWDECLLQLKREVPEVQFNTWVRPLTPVEDRNAFVLRAPNRFIRDFVEDKYSHLINECLSMLSTEVQSPTLSGVTAGSGGVSQGAAAAPKEFEPNLNTPKNFRLSARSQRHVCQPRDQRGEGPSQQQNLVDGYTGTS